MNPIPAGQAEIRIRPLSRADFDAVVSLDRLVTGRSRGPYFQRRLDAALRQPRRHLQLAADGPQGVTGFALARAAGGEFGRPGEVLALESIGVDPRQQHAGIGRRLTEELEALARARGMGAVVTQALWTDHEMLHFLAGAGFALGPQLILERGVQDLARSLEPDEEREPPLVRRLAGGDLNAIVRIDRKRSGAERRDYLQRKVDEALHESAIAVSLVAENDGLVVAFATAHVDSGDFGHMEPAAQLDTIGVHPNFARQGFATALLAQMARNLAALRVERLETEVARDDFELLGFLYGLGFEASRRLPFARAV